MANLAGKVWLAAAKPQPDPAVAVDEWSSRMGTCLPGEVSLPRNTLRGHPQPWRTRSVEPTITDPGPLHSSVYRPGGDGTVGSMTGHYLLGGPPPGTINPYVQKTSSTSALQPSDWETRLGGTDVLRGSLTPNWKPFNQEDLTKTGSCNGGTWDPTTHTTGILVSVTQPKAKTNSTASVARTEWETRLNQYGTGTGLAV